MVEIKICGITKFLEIQYINILKPDYIGFVFTESKRRISKEQALKLSNELDPNVKKVAVFRKNSIDDILDVINTVPIDIVQLHGEENSQYIKILQNKLKINIDIWKAIGVNSDTKNKNYNSYDVQALVLDNVIAGSGQSFQWKMIKDCNFNKSIFLAGGINEENVLQGIEAIKPRGIDVSSGVELINENGERMKSFNKMENLIRKVRGNYEGKI